MPQLTFTTACELIRDIVGTAQYKVILSYHPTISWSFKFERSLKQYDPIDILYMHLHQLLKPSSLQNMVANLPLSISDCIVLVQLSNGVWKHFVGSEREKYEERRREFTSITGIVVR